MTTGDCMLVGDNSGEMAEAEPELGVIALNTCTVLGILLSEAKSCR